MVTAPWTLLTQFPVSSTFGGPGKVFSEVNLELLLLADISKSEIHGNERKTKQMNYFEP